MDVRKNKTYTTYVKYMYVLFILTSSNAQFTLSYTTVLIKFNTSAMLIRMRGINTDTPYALA